MHTKKINKFHVDRPQFWGRFIFMLVAFATLAATHQETTLQHPLTRTDTRIYNFVVQVENKKTSSRWPILPHTSWSFIDSNSVVITDFTGNDISSDCIRKEETDLAGQWYISIPLQNYKVEFQSTTFSSELDEKDAVNIPWPEEWADEFDVFLQPSKFIQSGDQIFQDAINENGNPKSVSIHIAAKVLIRYCLQHIQSDGLYSKSKGSISQGLKVRGARNAVKTGNGSAVDLVCTCIAILRAAGIPARPVVGVTVADTLGAKEIAPSYIVWGEYALPGVGWIPFNTKRMRGTVDNLSLSEPWQGLGTLPWLNRRIPIAWNFLTKDIDYSKQQFQITFVGSPNK